MIRGDETVLLVDDGQMVLDVGTKLLEKLGYATMKAHSGQQALETYQANADTIACVILDMIMPGLDGGATYDRLKKLNPDVKVLLSSGYSIDGRASEILQRGCSGFIQKPFNLETLSRKLRDVLDSG